MGGLPKPEGGVWLEASPSPSEGGDVMGSDDRRKRLSGTVTIGRQR